MPVGAIRLAGLIRKLDVLAASVLCENFGVVQYQLIREVLGLLFYDCINL